jgi:hypothetical protein
VAPDHRKLDPSEIRDIQEITGFEHWLLISILERDFREKVPL